MHEKLMEMAKRAASEAGCAAEQIQGMSEHNTPDMRLRLSMALSLAVIAGAVAEVVKEMADG